MKSTEKKLKEHDEQILYLIQTVNRMHEKVEGSYLFEKRINALESSTRLTDTNLQMFREKIKSLNEAFTELEQFVQDMCR